MSTACGETVVISNLFNRSDSKTNMKYNRNYCLALCYSLTMWRYWFRLSRYVYGGNRSFAPILRQSQ